MDDDADPLRPRFHIAAFATLLCAFVCLASGKAGAQSSTDSRLDGGDAYTAALPIYEMVSPAFALSVLVLILLSGFFSASEVSFFSIHQLRLRGLAESGGRTGRLVSAMMERPGHLLTTILVGNMVVNVLISVLLPSRVQGILEENFLLPGPVAYLATVLICTAFLVYFGEITPKVFAVRVSELFARAAAFPLKFVDWVLGPICWGLIRFTNFVFRVTRFDDIQAAPFITDEEFKSLLTHSGEQGVIEEEEGQMIQGILEFRDALLREILVPRPDVIAINEEATVDDALELFRKHEFSRMPVYHDDLDHITGMLFAKDLLPRVARGEHEKRVRTLARPAHFVPVTMTIQGFVKDAQRVRMHQAVVVDEYGGTEGIVTLEDAIEEVVGDIQEEDKSEKPLYLSLGDGVYRVDGRLPLDELSELIGIDIQDDEHETVAGFLMDQTSKVPEVGDRVNYLGAIFTVERVEGKRVASLRVHLADAGPVRQKT